VKIHVENTVTNPTLGLNTKYRAKFDRNMRPCLTMTLIQFLYLSLLLNAMALRNLVCCRCI
jgi:hypothetical protein